jgi:4-amino-4-deoxy-L-arabinose transferase-like glycosyltransferase
LSPGDADPRPAPARRIAGIALVLWIAATWLGFLSHRDVVEPDEGRYAEIPREMLATGDWITPRLDGFVYFEKPPLQYWATAAAYVVLGVGNGAARTWPAALGLLTVLFVWRLARRLYGPEVGDLAAILLASTAMWFGMSHILTLDTSLSAFLVLAIGALAWAQTLREEPARLARWMLLAWASLALAVLSKGPVALVLAGGTVLVYGFFARDLAIWRHLCLGRGIVVLAAISGPWFVAVEMRNPGFARFFFLHENFERFTTDVHRRVEPWWTYLPVVALGSLPWIRPAVLSLGAPRFEPKSKGGFDPTRLLWTYCLLTVLFFSLSHSKLVPYVQPVFPALAILAARRLRGFRTLAFEAWLALLVGGAIAAVACFPPRLDASKYPPDIVAHCRPFVLVAAGAFLAAGAWVLARRSPLRTGAAFLGGATMLALQSILLAHQNLAPVKSAREVARAIDASVPQDAPVFSVRRYDQPLPFYLGRTVEIVAYRGELAYGMDRAPERAIPDVDAFRRIWNTVPQAAAVLSQETYAQEEARGLPMRKVFEDPRRVVVVRR